MAELVNKFPSMNLYAGNTVEVVDGVFELLSAIEPGNNGYIYINAANLLSEDLVADGVTEYSMYFEVWSDDGSGITTFNNTNQAGGRDINLTRTAVSYNFTTTSTSPYIKVRELTNGATGFLDGNSFSVQSLESPGIIKIINNSLSLIEDSKSYRALTKIKNEVVNTVEATIKKLSMIRIISDTIQLIETSNRVMAFIRIKNETINIIENIIRKISITRVISENVSIIETLINKISTFILKIINSTIQINENITKIVATSIIKIIDNSVQVAESIIRKLSYVGVLILKVINNSINVTESILTFKSIKIIISNSISIVESKIKAMALRKIISDSISLVENFSSLRAIKRVINNTISISENVLKYASQLILKIINETISISESFTKLFVDLINFMKVYFSIKQSSIDFELKSPTIEFEILGEE